MSPSQNLMKYWYSVAAFFSTAATAIFFPASRVYLPWMLLAVAVIGGYNAVSNLQRQMAAMVRHHAEELAEANRWMLIRIADLG